jgi:hypothetical protein
MKMDRNLTTIKGIYKEKEILMLIGVAISVDRNVMKKEALTIFKYQ